MTPNALGAGAAQPDYNAMATPSVWRTRDRTQAAAKVDALSSGGMDDFEIPAFLRKQAD
jgi:cell division protein FtsZ